MSYSKKKSFSMTPNSQYFLAKFQGLILGLSKINWCEGSWIIDSFYIYFDFFSASKSRTMTMRPPLTSMASKAALPNILKIVSNQCISYNDSWEVWIVGRDRTKTKCPQLWGVWKFPFHMAWKCMTEKNIRVKRMKLHNLSWSELNYASGKVV